MTFNIIFKKVGYSISFGDSAINNSIYLFTIAKEWYNDNGDVLNGKWICGYFMRRKFRRMVKNKTH